MKRIIPLIVFLMVSLIGKAHIQFDLGIIETNHSSFIQDTTHQITLINPDTLNTITLSDYENVMVGSLVTITVTPNEFYELDTLKIYETNNPNQIVDTVSAGNNTYTFIMPDFDVTVFGSFRLLPPKIFGNIAAPNAICAGDSLELTEPWAVNYIGKEWQISEDNLFSSMETYIGQPLDGGHNGWFLRFAAWNSAGSSYSNAVTIIINDLSASLEGESIVCNYSESTYQVIGAEHAEFVWFTPDTIKTIIPELNMFWLTDPGKKEISVLVTDTITGCSTVLTLEVTVETNITDDLTLVARKTQEREYMLICPNPQDLNFKYQWYKNDEILEGRDKQYYYVPIREGGLESGIYKVYVSRSEDSHGNAICGIFSPEYEIKTPELNPSAKIYPNPAHHDDDLTILNECGQEGIITIYTVDGRLIHHQSFSSNQVQLSKKLLPGIYVAHINNGYDLVNIVKIVIQ